MRVLTLLVPIAILAACSSDGSYASGLPAGSACMTDYDCQGQLNCAYPIAQGCVATGVCMNMGPLAASGACPNVVTACTCTAQTIEIPRCWTSVAPQPVLFTGPCVGADAGAIDAGADAGAPDVSGPDVSAPDASAPDVSTE